MSTSPVVILAGKEIRTVRRDPLVYILLVAMPLALIAFLGGGIERLVETAGGQITNGANFVVPAYTITFAFYMIGTLGFGFINEHAWGTWDRLRAAPVQATSIMLGKLVPYAAVSCLQFAVLFGIGWVVLGMSRPASPIAMVAVTIATIAVVLSTAMALVAICRTAQQVVAIGNVVNIVFAAIGGALLPEASLAPWIQHLSVFTPHYWAIQGYEKILNENAGLQGVAVNVGVLLGIAAVLTAVTIRRFHFANPKLTVQ